MSFDPNSPNKPGDNPFQQQQNNPFQPTSHGPGPMMNQGPKQSPLAITSMITGIISILTCWCCFLGFPLSITAVVTGIIGMNQVKSGNYQGKPFALTGLICGGISLALSILWFVLNLIGSFAGG